MAAETTMTLSVGLTYTDYSTRTYKIPYRGTDDDSDLNTVKTRIRAFNTAAQTDGSSVKQTFLSENGAQVASIGEATIVERTEEVIYGG